VLPLTQVPGCSCVVPVGRPTRCRRPPRAVSREGVARRPPDGRRLSGVPLRVAEGLRLVIGDRDQREIFTDSVPRAE